MTKARRQRDRLSSKRGWSCARSSRFIRFAPILAACLLCLAGCRSTGSSLFRRDASVDDLTNTDQIRGPIQRVLNNGAGNQSVAPAEGLVDFEQAEQLYKAGDYPAAEKALKKVAKKYKDSSIREDALFLLAECRFEQKRYSWAQDSYDELLKDYPSTRYIDRVTRRMFTIGQTWLGFPEVATSGEIQPVNFENPKATPRPKTAPPPARDPSLAVPIIPNVVDRSRPVFDTRGRGLQALKSIWLHDPTGPLADDALMLTASYHLRRGDNMEADHVFKILREDYPKSPHLESAFVLGSHVSLMSYQGAHYDDKKLDEAQQLKESTLRLFPNSADRDRIRAELKQIEEIQAKRDYEQAKYYLKKNNPRGAAIYCRQVIERFPTTEHAQKAREMLAEITGTEAASEPRDALPPPAEAEPPRVYDSGANAGRARL
jgi:outer membrane protein assembly factor BamD (BamD/ComL family)